MIEGLKLYPEMRASGVEWLPALPDGWQMRRAKYSFSEVDDRSEAGGEELLSVSHKTGVTPRSQKNITMFMAESYDGHKLCRPGDVVVNTMWAWMAAVGVSRHTGIISPAYGVYRPRSAENFEPKFLDYLIRTDIYRAEYLRSSRGITTSRLRLYPPEFLNIPFVQPPLDEQRLIVRFLDWHGTQAAKLIRSKKRISALLSERKQIVINEAMTRGFNRDNNFRDSGSLWLGDVPTTWEIKRLKWVTRLQRGYDLPSEKRIAGPYPVVSSGGVIDRHIECKARAPEVVMGRYGSTEAVFYIEEDYWPHNTSLFVTDFQGNDPQWCYYLLRSISKADHSGKSAVPGIDRKDLFDITVALPTYDDQVKIVSGIEKRTKEIDKSIYHIEEEITLIQEFRTRLIADVVTGKLDVRAAAASLPALAEAEPDDTLADEDDLDEAADAFEDEEAVA